jgi:hypothetical protein
MELWYGIGVVSLPTTGDTATIKSLVPEWFDTDPEYFITYVAPIWNPNSILRFVGGNGDTSTTSHSYYKAPIWKPNLTLSRADKRARLEDQIADCKTRMGTSPQKSYADIITELREQYAGQDHIIVFDRQSDIDTELAQLAKTFAPKPKKADTDNTVPDPSLEEVDD